MIEPFLVATPHACRADVSARDEAAVMADQHLVAVGRSGVMTIGTAE